MWVVVFNIYEMLVSHKTKGTDSFARDDRIYQLLLEPLVFSSYDLKWWRSWLIHDQSKT